MSKGSRNRTKDKRRFDDNFDEIRWHRKRRRRPPLNDIFNEEYEMTDENDLPLEPVAHGLPMSLLADGVAPHYGRNINDEPDEDMSDAKEQKLIEARAEADRKLAEVCRKRDEAYRKVAEVCRKVAEVCRKRDEAYRKCDKTTRKLREYRASKARQSGKAGS